MYMSWVFCLHVWICNMCVPGICGGQRKVADPLGPKLLIGKSRHLAVGIEPRPSGRAASILAAGPSLHIKERLCTLVIFLPQPLQKWDNSPRLHAQVQLPEFFSLSLYGNPVRNGQRPSTAVLTGKSLLSFFRGSCGACADPSVLSLISFEIPSPFPKETVVNAEWAHKTEHSLTSTFLSPSFPFLLGESAEACFCQVTPFTLGSDSQVALYPYLFAHGQWYSISNRTSIFSLSPTSSLGTTPPPCWIASNMIQIFLH